MIKRNRSWGTRLCFKLVETLALHHNPLHDNMHFCCALHFVFPDVKGFLQQTLQRKNKKIHEKWP